MLMIMFSDVDFSFGLKEEENYRCAHMVAESLTLADILKPSSLRITWQTITDSNAPITRVTQNPDDGFKVN